MKKYTVHTSYINSQGVIIRQGVYSEDEIDVAEARRRSYISLVGTSAPIEQEVPKLKEDPVAQINIDNVNHTGIKNNDDIAVIKIDTTSEEVVSKNKPVPFKPNTASLSAYIKLPYVGKKTAENAIQARNQAPFLSYQDMDRRVPLSKNRMWEDVAPMDFTTPDVFDNISAGLEVTNTAVERPQLSVKED